jgi:hypothetical protein
MGAMTLDHLRMTINQSIFEKKPAMCARNSDGQRGSMALPQIAGFEAIFKVDGHAGTRRPRPSAKGGQVSAAGAPRSPTV